MVARQWVVVVLLGALASLGAQHRTKNFIVEAATPQLAERFGQWAEYYRKQKADPVAGPGDAHLGPAVPAQDHGAIQRLRRGDFLRLRQRADPQHRHAHRGHSGSARGQRAAARGDAHGAGLLLPCSRAAVGRRGRIGAVGGRPGAQSARWARPADPGHAEPANPAEPAVPAHAVSARRHGAVRRGLFGDELPGRQEGPAGVPDVHPRRHEPGLGPGGASALQLPQRQRAGTGVDRTSADHAARRRKRLPAPADIGRGSTPPAPSDEPGVVVRQTLPPAFPVLGAPRPVVRGVAASSESGVTRPAASSEWATPSAPPPAPRGRCSWAASPQRRRRRCGWKRRGRSIRRRGPGRRAVGRRERLPRAGRIRAGGTVCPGRPCRCYNRIGGLGEAASCPRFRST